MNFMLDFEGSKDSNKLRPSKYLQKLVDGLTCMDKNRAFLSGYSPRGSRYLLCTIITIGSNIPNYPNDSFLSLFYPQQWENVNAYPLT